MKRKENKKNHKDTDSFGKKEKKNVSRKDRSSKRKLTIYDEFEDEDLDLDDYQLGYDEEE